MTETPKSPRSIHELSIKGFNIQIQRNAYPRGSVMKYIFSNIDNLLVDATRILKLPSQAVKVFSEDGKRVKDRESVEKGKLYYISCGEDFASGVNVSQKLKQKPKSGEEEEDEGPQTFYEQTIQQNKEKEAQKALENQAEQKPEKTKQEIKKEKEAAAFNRLLALSNKTVQEAFIESTLAAFASTEPKQKSELQNYSQLATLTKNTQYYDFINQLITNQLAPTFATTKLQDEIDMFFIDMLKSISMDKLQFIITGYPQTGKSSVLYSLSTILLRKIQQSSANNKFLFFPINAEKLTLELASVTQTYNVWVTTTLTAARYSNYAIAPCNPSLLQWFCSIPVTPVLASFPIVSHTPNAEDKIHIHGVDLNAIQALGQKIFTISHNKAGLEEFVNAIVEFPREFAAAIGLTDVFYIIDHFEYLDVAYRDVPLFSEYLKTVQLAPLVCNVLSPAKFVVSCETEPLFAKAFTCEEATPIDTEGIIESNPDTRKLTILPMKLTLTTEDCKGCPGILAQFTKVADLASNIGKEPAQNKGVKARTSIARSRYLLLKKQLLYLIKTIALIGNERISLNTLNIIDDANIEVKVEKTEEQTQQETATPAKSASPAKPSSPSPAQKAPTSQKSPIQVIPPAEQPPTSLQPQKKPSEAPTPVKNKAKSVSSKGQTTGYNGLTITNDSDVDQDDYENDET